MQQAFKSKGFVVITHCVKVISKPKKILLMRHGQSRWNKFVDIYGRLTRLAKSMSAPYVTVNSAYAGVKGAEEESETGA